MNKLRLLITTTLMAAGLSLPAMAQGQGVSDTEIVIGSNQDMSGIFGGFGSPAINAANQYFNQVNEQGGVHGRKIRFVVEDHAYQMPKAVAGLNKLVNSDQVFAMILSLGTPMNMAAFPLMEQKQIANIAPLSSARQMIEPPSPYRYAAFSAYYDQARLGVKYLAGNNGAKIVCSMVIPSDFGKEIQAGARDGAAENNIEYKAETTHKPDEQDFTGSLTRLNAEKCDTVVLALGVRQTITAVATAKKLGFDNMTLLGTSASMHSSVAKVPGGVTQGFYATSGWVDLESRLDDPEAKAFAEAYQAEFGEFPGTGALLGRSAAETLVRALEAAGRDLTPKTFQTAMESLSYEDRITGVKTDYSADDHQGADLIVISKVKDGKWVEQARE